MKLRIVLSVLAPILSGGLLTASAALSDDWGDNKEDYTSGPEYEASKAVCRSLKGVQPPTADMPGAAAAKALKGCDSEALYYGIGMKADPAKARQCAFAEIANGEDTASFTGERMLMVIYANGVGAKRNLDLATHYACRVEDAAPMEMTGRIEHLQDIKAGKRAEVFDYCDDITSGYAMGECAAHGQRIAGGERAGKIASLSAGWNAAQKGALTALLAAKKAWVSAIDGEVDVSGTGRASFIIDAEETQENDFLELLTLVASGKLPKATAAEAKAADAALNTAYGKVMKGDEADWGTVKKTDIRDVQRAWIRYRDAWVAFGKAFGLPPETLVTWLTKKRTAALKDFAGES